MTERDRVLLTALERAVSHEAQEHTELERCITQLRRKLQVGENTHWELQHLLRLSLELSLTGATVLRAAVMIYDEQLGFQVDS